MKSIARLLGITLFALGASAQTEPQIALRQVATNLSAVIDIQHAGDSRLFAVIQTGRIIVIEGNTVRPTPFLDITPLVSCCLEQGLLGLAFHPRYQANGYFYVNYTDKAGDTIVARYQVLPNDRNRADPGSAVQILKVDQPFANHNGGGLAFGPDGYLYIGLGDGGSGNDPGNRGQNLSELLGKMLRIDVDGGSPYAIPPTNPMLNRAGARPEIWAYGLRNPWRYSFDRRTGDLFIADVGQQTMEEVNFQSAGSPGGENYGWRLMEGSRCFIPSSNCQGPDLVLPILEYTHSLGCSITGGYRYRGTSNPRLEGMYFYGDYCRGTIYGATQASDGTWTSRLLMDTTMLISTFGQDVAGELYVADHNGTIWQIYDPAPDLRRRRSVRR